MSWAIAEGVCRPLLTYCRTPGSSTGARPASSSVSATSRPRSSPAVTSPRSPGRSACLPTPPRGCFGAPGVGRVSADEFMGFVQHRHRLVPPGQQVRLALLQARLCALGECSRVLETPATMLNATLDPQYVGEGMEEGEMSEAREDLAALEKVSRPAAKSASRTR